MANFEDPRGIPEDQYFQTQKIAASPETEGLEFVRSWDTVAVSMISMLPFVLSIVFAGVWIGISVQRNGVDAQVATQTAFTVSSYIGTAGILRTDVFPVSMLTTFCRCFVNSVVCILR